MSVKISELPILDSLADNDIVAGVDVSGNVTSKIEMSTLKNYIDTNTQYTAGTNIDITNNVISAPDVPTKEEFDSLSTIFNAFPTESDEDESMTLDGTAEVKFKKFDLKGNTSQTTYSGKNLLLNTRDEGYTVTSNGITFKVNADKSITVSGTATGTASMTLNTGVPVTLSAGTYTLSKKETTDVQVAIWYDSASVWTAVRGNTTAIQTTISENTTFNNWRTLVVVYQGVTVNTTVYPMLEKSSTETSYEPYVGGTASPNPSYPQDVHVVSGDNEINVCGKNLCPNSANTQTLNSGGTLIKNNDGTYTLSGGKSNVADLVIIGTINVKLGETYYLSNDFASGTNNLSIRRGSTSLVGTTSQSKVGYTATANETLNVYIRYQDTATLIYKPMISKNVNDTFEPYQGNTYNIDLPALGKNLFNKNSHIVNGSFINGSGGITSDGTLSYQDYFIEVEQNTDYTISSSVSTVYRIAKYDSNKTFINRPYNENPSTSYTINTGNAKYIKMAGTLTSALDSLQIEKNSSATPYEPFNDIEPIELCKIGNYQDYFYKDSDKWYLHKEIGKVVLNGSENITSNPNGTNSFYVPLTNLFASGTQQDVISNYFKGVPYSERVSGGDNICYSERETAMTIRNTTFTSVSSIKSWLEINNTNIYYKLATPTNIEITDTTLISQLNAIEKAQSKENQTNISQVNNDLPFIISAEAILSLKNVLDRIELLES